MLKDFDLPWPFKATPEHKERGLHFVKHFSDFVAAGKIKPGPIQVMPNGLAGVPDGIRYMLEGKVNSRTVFVFFCLLSK